MADYVAEVGADTIEDALDLAQDKHSDYNWEHQQTVEFEARPYVMLNAEGNEIDATQVGNF